MTIRCPFCGNKYFYEHHKPCDSCGLTFEEAKRIKKDLKKAGKRYRTCIIDDDTATLDDSPLDDEW